MNLVAIFLKMHLCTCFRANSSCFQRALIQPLVSPSISVKERCLAQQKKRRRRATKKICVFIGSFILCFSPYVITR